MIAATVRTIAGRRGTFLGGAALALLVVIGVAVVRTIVNARDPETHPSIGGFWYLEAAVGLLFFVGLLVAILMGALAGSYDVAQGTMRYLLMTGRSRGAIYATRAVALVLSVFLALAPAVALRSSSASRCPTPTSRASSSATCSATSGRSRSSSASTRS